LDIIRKRMISKKLPDTHLNVVNCEALGCAWSVKFSVIA
jgi:hypothetical protein